MNISSIILSDLYEDFFSALRNSVLFFVYALPSPTDVNLAHFTNVKYFLFRLTTIYA